MNKQELIDKLKELITESTNEYDCGHDYGIRRAIVFAEQLDEPVKPPEPKPLEIEKPVVPKYVADWLEVCKDNLPLSLAHSMNNIIMMSNNQPDKTIHWIAKKSETFAKAWLYGYEVEKEKLYTVEIPNPNGGEYSRVYLGKYSSGKVGLYSWTGFAHIAYADDWKKEEKAQLTEAEIKEDFEWAWQFAEEVKKC